jgi:UDP-N-acetylmuramoyl-L-alanyl-D-glutamate--2,6-diaminopimelate ligase
MERVEAGQPFLAVVDYAHTPGCRERLLSAVRAVTPGKVVVVWLRRGPRPRQAAGHGPRRGRGADVAVLTSDNPRSEDPAAILAEMAAGRPGRVHEVDRRAAIALAVLAGRPG